VKVRINSYDGKFYPEVQRKRGEHWEVLSMSVGTHSTGWRFHDFSWSVRAGTGFDTKEKALDLLESYLGAGKSVIACDIIRRRWWHK